MINKEARGLVKLVSSYFEETVGFRFPFEVKAKFYKGAQTTQNGLGTIGGFFVAPDQFGETDITIYVCIDACGNDQEDATYSLYTIAHELVHAWQYIRGDLCGGEIIDNVGRYYYWKGEKRAIYTDAPTETYRNYPWEIEAHKVGMAIHVAMIDDENFIAKLDKCIEEMET